MTSLLVTSALLTVVCLLAVGVYFIVAQVVVVMPLAKDTNTSDTGHLSACGRGHRRYKRIVNGDDTSPGQFSWMVMVLVKGRFRCGGSILDDQHVLTAAHCVSNGRHKQNYEANDTEVIAGKHAYVTLPRDTVPTEQRVTVIEVIAHPQYSATAKMAKDHDLAILKLRTKLIWTNWVSPICLPKSSDSVLPQTGTVIGWGSVHARNRINWIARAPTVLQQLTVRVRFKGDCLIHLSYPYTKYMTKRQICAISVRTGVSSTCNGDSGGPLFTVDRDTGYPVQFGVLSWGFCASSPRTPSFFTYLPSYVPWISAVTDHIIVTDHNTSD